MVDGADYRLGNESKGTSRWYGNAEEPKLTPFKGSANQQEVDRG
jgi:hypothetical protein